MLNKDVTQKLHLIEEPEKVAPAPHPFPVTTVWMAGAFEGAVVRMQEKLFRMLSPLRLLSSVCRRRSY